MRNDRQTTCSIYQRAIRDARDGGCPEQLSRLVETWYTRLVHMKGIYAKEIKKIGKTGRRVIWIEFCDGSRVEYRKDWDEWRMIEKEYTETREGEPVYEMAKIAESLGVPFAYLSGAMDAVSTVDEETIEMITRCRSLRSECEKLEQKKAELRKEIAKREKIVGAVMVSGKTFSGEDVSLRDELPEAPTAGFDWDGIRRAFRDTPGIYFAWNRGKIVYVGGTEVGMWARLQKDHSSVARDDMFSFVEVPKDQVWFSECCYIAKYAPERNACVAQAVGKRRGGHRGKRRVAVPQ